MSLFADTDDQTEEYSIKLTISKFFSISRVFTWPNSFTFSAVQCD
jgi:hypothetical protein